MATRVRRTKRRAAGTGSVRRLATGWQARYPSPTVVEVVELHGESRTRPKLVAAPVIFESRIDAEAWLDAASWLEPDESTAPRIDPPLRTYAEAWLAVRELKPRTRAHYRRLLDRQVLPDLGDRAISTISGLSASMPT